MVAALVVILVTFAALRAGVGASGIPLPDRAILLLRVVVLGLAAVGTLGLRVIRRALPSVPPESSRAAWWEASLGRVVALWALPDGVAAAASALYFVSGDVLLLALAGGWAIAMLVAYAPGRLTDG